VAVVLASCSSTCAGDDPGRTIARVVDAATHPYLTRASFADRQLDVRRLYDSVGSTPIWVRDGKPTPEADETIAVLSAAGTRGLRAAEYDADRLRDGAARLSATSHPSAEDVALFDMAVTISLMRYATDAYLGRISPASLGFVLDPEPKEIDLPAFVAALARSDRVGEQLATLDPPVPIFARLRGALAETRALAARTDLPELAGDTPTLRLGDRHPAVVPLRRWLVALGDLPAPVPPLDEMVYDRDVADAVKRFQLRHGRDADGILGRVALHDLRVPLVVRVEQIELAMERLRWPSSSDAARSVIVNIPEFRLRAFDGDDSVPRLSMKVVVGSVVRRTKTPVVHGHMRWVVFRPYWDVPARIARKEILPRAAREPGYLEREQMELRDGHLRQRPGPKNALGLAKFVFPNPFDVYLHDTPQKEYFARSRRDLSHGCMRVSEAIALAEFVLGWDRGRIAAAMTEGPNNHWVEVPGTIPVYVLYTTVAVEDGRILFFDDIYGNDSALESALDNRYPDQTGGGGARTGDTAGGGGGGTRVYRPGPGERALAASPRPALRTVGLL
jgi:murein L,D-transpeptidase YcbB/YkuD